MVAFGLSWGPVPWAMPAEVHSSSYRAKGVALSTCSNWLNNFIIVRAVFDRVMNALLMRYLLGTCHTAYDPAHRLRYLHLLRRVLLPVRDLGMVHCSRDKVRDRCRESQAYRWWISSN
jgi:hypothetical protein